MNLDQKNEFDLELCWESMNYPTKEYEGKRAYETSGSFLMS